MKTSLPVSVDNKLADGTLNEDTYRDDDSVISDEPSTSSNQRKEKTLRCNMFPHSSPMMSLASVVHQHFILFLKGKVLP